MAKYENVEKISELLDENQLGSVLKKLSATEKNLSEILKNLTVLEEQKAAREAAEAAARAEEEARIAALEAAKAAKAAEEAAKKAAEEAANKKAMELLDFMGLADVADVKAGSLPYGVQRRLEIVRALATNPSIILLDEPAAGMNPSETAELMHQIRRIRDTFHIAIFLIEHDMKLVMNVCEAIAVINYGRLIAKGTPEEIRANPAVIEAYLGKEEDQD